MYLLQLDPFTGLVKTDDELDGWMAIESFRELVAKKGYGIQALTCVALTMDYGSLIRNYSEKERPLKAMEIVYNTRKAILWNCDEIQLACINYKELQYNATLEEKTILDELRIAKLSQIKEEQDSTRKQFMLKELSSINDLHESFEKKNGSKDLFSESIVRNKYTLSRLEVKILDKKSFYYEREQRAKRAKERSESERDTES